MHVMRLLIISALAAAAIVGGYTQAFSSFEGFLWGALLLAAGGATILHALVVRQRRHDAVHAASIVGSRST